MFGGHREKGFFFLMCCSSLINTVLHWYVKMKLCMIYLNCSILDKCVFVYILRVIRLHIRTDDYKYVNFQQNGEVAHHDHFKKSRPRLMIHIRYRFYPILLLRVDSEAMRKGNFQLVLSQV